MLSFSARAHTHKRGCSTQLEFAIRALLSLAPSTEISTRSRNPRLKSHPPGLNQSWVETSSSQVKRLLEASTNKIASSLCLSKDLWSRSRRFVIKTRWPWPRESPMISAIVAGARPGSEGKARWKLRHCHPNSEDPSCPTVSCRRSYLLGCLRQGFS